MRFFTFSRFMYQILRKKEANLTWIQSQGLLAVKLSQIFALRPDLLSIEKCKQLQTLYGQASTIPTENVQNILKSKASMKFHDSIQWFDDTPLAAASVGQVHRARLKTGEEVVVKIIKADHKNKFQKDVYRMKRWLKILILFSPKLRKVGNPIALLNHVEDYTLRELNLNNEIKGGNKLKQIQSDLEENFPMPRLKFPKYYEELSNEDVLVSEFIDGITLEEGIRAQNLDWDYLIELFRIHGAYMFGVGTFHGDLHPGNCIIDKDGNFVFIDNGAICDSPKRISLSLFRFFEHLSADSKDDAYEALLALAESRPSENKIIKFKGKMSDIYDGFEDKSVGEQSLTEVMMKTVRAAVEEAGADFGEEAFPIIRSLMYMDGLVIRTHPDVKLIHEMGPSLDEFREGLGLGKEILV